MRPGDPNLAMLEAMAHHLGDLTEQLVFVGGCTTGLFVTALGGQRHLAKKLPPRRGARYGVIQLANCKPVTR